MRGDLHEGEHADVKCPYSILLFNLFHNLQFKNTIGNIVFQKEKMNAITFRNSTAGAASAQIQHSYSNEFVATVNYAFLKCDVTVALDAAVMVLNCLRIKVKVMWLA